MEKLLIFALILIVTIVGINAISPDPEAVANGERTKLRAEAQATQSAIKNEEARQISALNVEVARSAKDEEIAAQKIYVPAKAYAKIAATWAGVFALLISVGAIAYMVINLSIAYSKRAYMVANWTYPNKMGQLPVERRIATDPLATWVNHNNQAIYGTNRKDEQLPPVLELSAHAAAARELYIVADHAAKVAAKKESGMKPLEFLNALNAFAQIGRLEQIGSGENNAKRNQSR